MVYGRYDIHGVTKQHITGRWHHIVGFMVERERERDIYIYIYGYLGLQTNIQLGGQSSTHANEYIAGSHVSFSIDSC